MNLTSQKPSIQSISQILFEVEVQIHILHLNSKSYSSHQALGEFYTSLGGLNDDLVEKSFSKVGILKGYGTISIDNEVDALSYIKSKMFLIEKHREKVTTPFIQQMVDNILETFSHVIYKLENLK